MMHTCTLSAKSTEMLLQRSAAAGKLPKVYRKVLDRAAQTRGADGHMAYSVREINQSMVEMSLDMCPCCPCSAVTVTACCCCCCCLCQLAA